MRKILVLVIAAALACCTLDEPQTEALEDEYVLAASDCTVVEDCESQPEQTLAQCLAACEAGAAAIEVFCRLILHPVIREACWRVVYAGPTACSGFCYWYFTP